MSKPVVRALKSRILSFFIFIFLSCILCISPSYAQKGKADSLLQARKHSLDSMRSAQKHMLDSLKLSRTHTSDSIKFSRKRITDSLAAIRSYKTSKHYTDSVARSRQRKIDQLRASRKTSLDSLKASRKKSIDSVVLTRKTSLDKIKAVQKKHTDSVLVVRKYKESKRYKDSVTVTRNIKLNAIRKARKKTNDSLFAIRKQQMDIMKATRKHYSDSVARVQKKYIDSLKAVRKVRTDSLAKVKLAREKMQKALEKKKADKMNLALNIKIQKKREAWSNESMLKKRWAMPRKGLQNLYTHYNYYYNAKRRMKEAEDNMQRSKKDNFDSLLALYPFDPNLDSSLMKSDMDSIIQKTSIGIQIHDPRTKWADDLYLLLGQAFYYKGDYTNSSTSFKYIISMKAQEDLRKAKSKKGSTAHKKTGTNTSIVEEEDNKIWDILKHKSVHNEAILWLAHTYTEQGQINNAESVLELVESDPKFPGDLKGQLAMEKAFLYIHQNNYPLAASQLVIAKESPDLPDWVRRRASFLNGQILLQQGEYTVAADNFRKVVDMNPKIDMDFYARKYLANSLMLAGIGQEAATASLKKMLNDGKYLPYYEQVYYVLGGLCASTNNTEDAIDYYGKSIKAPKTTKKQKALSFAGLGNVYFNIGDYANAKKAYDSAAILASHAAGDPSITVAIKRSRALSEITGPALTIHVQDSMLYLASLSEKEQRAAARKYINSLQKKKNDSAFRATNVVVANNQMSDVVDIDFNTWYFSTPTLMQQGYSEFKRKWGTRPLVDNWRRQSALNNANADTTAALLADDDTNAEVDENGLPTESALIAMLPKTEEKQKVCFDRIQRAYIDLGAAYIKQLEEYARASATFDTLDRRFPVHKYKAEELYYRYEIALKQNNIPLAQSYSEQLFKDHPKSSWAARVRPTEDGDGITGNSKIEAGLYYQETYDLLMMRQYTEAIQHVNYAKDQYPDTKYKMHFKLIEATAFAASGEFDTADSLMVKYVGANPPDSLRKWSDAVLQFIAKSRPKKTEVALPVKDTTTNAQAAKANKQEEKATPLPVPAANVTKAPDTSTMAKIGGYIYESHEEHYFLFSFSAVDNRANTLKNSIAELNTQKFKGQPLFASVEMLQGASGFIIVRSFQNAAQGKFYKQNIETNPVLYSMYKAGEYQLLTISASNYQKLLNNHNIDSYITFYNTNYK